MAVAEAIIGVLEEAPDLFARERKTVAGHLGRCLAKTESRESADLVPAENIEVVLSQCKPRRAAVLDGPTTLNFYMSWLVTVLARLAPKPAIRQRVARIV